MATVDWLGLTWQQEGSDGVNLVYGWSLAGNWSGGAVPGADADVVIDLGVPGPVLQSAVSVSTLTVLETASVTVGAFLDHLHASYGAGRLSIGQRLTLDGALEVDSVAGDTGGSSLDVAGTVTIAPTGALSLGNSGQTAAATATVDALAIAGTIEIDGSAAPLAPSTLAVKTSAGFGLAGVLTGDVQLSGVSKIEFTLGGGIDEIGNGAALSLDGAQALLASGARGGNSALTTLGAENGDLSLLDGAAIRLDDALAIGDGVDSAMLLVGGGASLLTRQTITINANGALDLGAGARAYASSLAINGGALTLAAGAGLAAPIAFTGAGGALTLDHQTFFNISGSNGTVNVDDSTFRLTGGGFTVNLTGATNIAYLNDTGADADTVKGNFQDIWLQDAAASVTGYGDNIKFLDDVDDSVSLFDGGADRVVATDGAIELTNASAQILGGGNTVTFGGGAGNEAILFATDGVADNVFGSDGQVVLAGAQAVVSGGDDQIVFAVANDRVTLENTGSIADTVSRSGGEVTLMGADATLTDGFDNAVTFAAGTDNVLTLTDETDDTVYGTNGQIDLTTNAKATIVGGGDNIAFLDDGQRSARDVTLENTDGADDAVSGSNGTIKLLNATVDVTGYSFLIGQYGGGSNITLSGDDEFSSTVDNYNVLDKTYGTGQINLAGGLLDVEGDDMTVNFVSGFKHYVAFGPYQVSAGSIGVGPKYIAASGTVNGSNGTIEMDNYANGLSNVTVNGNDDRIQLNYNEDNIRLNGSAEQIYSGGILENIFGFNATDVIEFNSYYLADWQTLQGDMSQVGDDTVIAAINNHVEVENLTLKNVNLADLTMSEFKFV